MKWTSVTLDLSSIRKFIRHVASAGRTFASLLVCTVFFFAVLGIGTYMKDKAGGSSPLGSVKGLAASVSSGFFLDMLGMEVPHLNDGKTETTFSQKNVFGFLFRMATDINPHDPKSLLAHEVPGLWGREATLLHCRTCSPGDAPQDYTTTSDDKSGGSRGGNGPSDQAGTTVPTPAPAATPAPTPTPAQTPAANGRKIVMVYQSHDRESYLPEIGKTDPAEAYDETKNVTLVGARLADKLNAAGIGTIHSNADYKSAIKDFNYAYSYKYSGKTVKEAMASDPDLKFLFDIHRDDQPRSKTTMTYNGQDYAQVFFIIGQKNPNWKDNEKFASQLLDDLEKKVPGITKGIWGKSAKDGDAEYNQSLSPDSVLIEIGGPYNTLDECYRTADVLSGAIADLVRDATKASAPADKTKS